MRVGLVGLGDIGMSAHLPALERHSEIELTCVADTSPLRRAAAAKLGHIAVDGLEAVLASGVDGLVLATPPWVTPELASRAATAGVFVLAEKPVATSVAAAYMYAELTPEQQARIQVGLTYRHDPAMEMLASWIADGRLGTPLLVRAHVYDEQRRPDDAEHNERMLATLARGMPVVHEGAHVLDWLSYLLRGRPTAISDAWAVRTSTELPAPNLVGATMRYPGGHVALVEFGWLTDTLPRCELSVLGDRGLAVLDGTDFSLTLDGVTVTFPGDRFTRCFDRQLDRFVALYNGVPSTPSLSDGLAALHTAEQIVERVR